MQTGVSEMRALRSFLEAAVASRGAPEKREVHNWPERPRAQFALLRNMSATAIFNAEQNFSVLCRDRSRHDRPDVPRVALTSETTSTAAPNPQQICPFL
jgi:hypothetical protein